MTKSEYLSNSSKLFLIGSIMLFVANLIVYLGGFNFNEAVISIGSKISNFAFYVFLFIGFLAINGEGITYKRQRLYKEKKITNFFKFVLFFAFFVRFIKTSVEKIMLKSPGDSAIGSVSRLFLGFFNTFASYGFLLFVVAIWYIIRDKKYKKLFIPELMGILTGFLYNIYKTLNYSVVKYELTFFGESFIKMFSNTELLHFLCLIQFLSDIVMFAFVMIHYNKLIISEQEEKRLAQGRLLFAKNIYKDECFGIDNLEDDNIISKNKETQIDEKKNI